jgi:hypothetical protein
VTDDSPPADRSSLVQMKVASLTLDPLSGVPVVLLRDLGGQKELAVWVGKGEGAAIATHLERIQLDRPSTHDLMRNLLVTVGARVERVEIHDVVDETFYATTFVRPPGQKDAAAIAVDARPSDAIALALRTGAPIFVAERVLAKQADPMPPSSEAVVAAPLRLASVSDLAKWRM